MPYQRSPVPIGQRREKVAVQQPLTAEDGIGGQTLLRWQTIAEPWCQVTPLDERDKEALAGAQLVAKHAYHVVMPYRSDLTPQLRLIVRDTTMAIHTIVDDEGRRRRITVQCGQVQ